MLKILNLSWEFPPWKVGGISTYIVGLAKSLIGKGVEVHVICPGSEDKEDTYDGIHVHRFKADFPSNDFIAWVLQMNMFMKTKISEVWKQVNGFDIIHAHDWMSAMPALFAKDTYKAPLISTIHDTEQGRWGKGQGIQLINELEHKLCLESWKITVLSDFMKWHLQDLFGVPENKIWVISPGINTWEYQFGFDYWGVRNRFAAPFEKIILYVGRMFPQKGCDILVGAASSILSEFPNAKFVCIGEGFERMRYTDLANWLGVGSKFYFTGYLDDFTTRALMQIADALVIPSRHEPFGLVVLEGMAAKVPVVASDEGGMHNTIRHDVNGFLAWRENSDSVAYGIRKILRDPNYANWLRENGLKTINERFSWNKNADIMLKCYEKILAEFSDTSWSREKAAPLAQPQPS